MNMNIKPELQSMALGMSERIIPIHAAVKEMMDELVHPAAKRFEEAHAKAPTPWTYTDEMLEIINGLKAEAKKLFAALERADDVEDKRSLFQGWLALRAPMIIALLDAWEVEHDNGIVEDFDWVSKLSDEAIESSIKTVREAHPEEATDIAFMVYFAYLEMPEFEKWFKPEDVFKAHFEAAGAGAKGD